MSGSNSSLPIVGVVPMAGQAKRLPGLDGSKEIHRVSFGNNSTAQPVCEHLLEQMRAAGISDIYLVIRDGKWDIPGYLGDGSQLGLNLAYLMMGRPYGTPYSVDQAHRFVSESRVALGFPDMCFSEPGLFTRLIDHQNSSGADLVLGVFPADRPHKVDMLALDEHDRVTQLLIKPDQTDLQYTWGIALWTPVFTRFMHDFLDHHQHTAGDAPELYIGDVVRAAIEAGMDVQGIQVSSRPFIDIGTQEDLERARIPL